MAVSAIITLNTLEYIRKTSNLKILIRLYQKILNYLKIIYTIALIINSSFKNLNFLILPKISNISNSEKTIIFVNSIEKNTVLKIYLQTFLLNNLKNRRNNIIKFFLLILIIKTKTN